MASEREDNATADLAEKIALEAIIIRELNSLFRSMSRSMKNLFADTGNPLNANQFKPTIKQILTDQYNRTFRRFAGDISSQNDLILSPGAENIIGRRNDRFIEIQSETQATRITNTNQKEINLAIAGTIAALTEIGAIGETSNAQIGDEASNAFLRRSISRSETIALTETQNAAETEKQNEMEALILTGAISGALSNKQWTAILDNRVRSSHAEADGQIRNINEPFEVQGELLMKPGDKSLGASAGNIINCRCSSSLTLSRGGDFI